MKKSAAQTTHSFTTETGAFSIQRRSSRYNITGPNGREFAKYESAGLVGPRWEELTHTAWPHASSAYMPGSRLFELGITPVTDVQPPKSKPQPPGSRPVPHRESASGSRDEALAAQQLIRPVQANSLPLALPAPRIDLQEQQHRMQQLRRDPALLFAPHSQETLRREVEYYLPYARWAAHLLRLLERYERKRRRQGSGQLSAHTVLARHLAWQAQQNRTYTGKSGSSVS